MNIHDFMWVISLDFLNQAEELGRYFRNNMYPGYISWSFILFPFDKKNALFVLVLILWNNLIYLIVSHSPNELPILAILCSVLLAACISFFWSIEVLSQISWAFKASEDGLCQSPLIRLYFVTCNGTLSLPTKFEGDY